MANLLAPVANLHSAHVLLTLRILGCEFTLVISPVGESHPACVCVRGCGVCVGGVCVCVGGVCVCVCVCVCVWSMHVCVECVCVWSVYVGMECVYWSVCVLMRSTEETLTLNVKFEAVNGLIYPP